MTPLLRRVLAENRTLTIVLSLALLANVLAYILVVPRRGGRPVLPTGLRPRRARWEAADGAADALSREGACRRGAGRVLQEGAAGGHDGCPSHDPCQPACAGALHRHPLRSADHDGRTIKRCQPRTHGDSHGAAGDYENCASSRAEVAPEFVIIDDVVLDESRGDEACA
jgi:hypothetical protein